MKLLRIALTVGILSVGLAFAHGDETVGPQVVKGKVISVEKVKPNQWAPVKALKIEVKQSNGEKVNIWIPPVWTNKIQINKGDSVIVNGMLNPFSMLVANTIEDVTNGKTFELMGPEGRKGYYGPRGGRGMMGPRRGMMGQGSSGYGGPNGNQHPKSGN